MVSIQCLNEENTNNHRGSMPIFFPSGVIILQRRMLIRRISIPLSSTLVIWMLLISPYYVHTAIMTYEWLDALGAYPSSLLSYSPCLTDSLTHTYTPHQHHSVPLLPVVPALHWWWFWRSGSTFCCWWRCGSSSSSAARPRRRTGSRSAQQSSGTVFLCHCQGHLGTEGELLMFWERFLSRVWNVSVRVWNIMRVGVLAWVHVCFSERNPDYVRLLCACVHDDTWVCTSETVCVRFASVNRRGRHIRG